MAAGTLQARSSIHQLLRAAWQQLDETSPSPRLDAELLLTRASGLDRAGLIKHGDECLSREQIETFGVLLAARAAGTPIAYLLGQREFWSLSFVVTDCTLIPRPETELLVETALDLIDCNAVRRLADLGTGAGTIALALAHEHKRLDITATDLSEPALAIARANAARFGLDQIHFLAGDWFRPLADQQFDLIVSNPPYVAEGDPHLDKGDVRFEPRAALTAGRDGLDAIRRIVADAPRHLHEEGWLLLEHGHDQGAAVRALLADHGFEAISTRVDLAGLDRVTLGRTIRISETQAID